MIVIVNSNNNVKPMTTLYSVFKKPKDQPPEDRVTGGGVQSRVWGLHIFLCGGNGSRSVEQRPARAASKTSAIRHHIGNQTADHNIHPRHGCILEMNVHNYGKILFLESLHSELDKNTVNERSAFPRAYVPLLRTLGGTQQSDIKMQNNLGWVIGIIQS